MNRTNLLDYLVNISLPLIVGLVFVLGIFKLHMLPFLDSMLNEQNSIVSNGFLVSQIEYHKEFAPFARRPLTSLLINGVSDWFGLKPGMAFVWVNFSLFLIGGLLLYFLSRMLTKNYWFAVFNLLSFYVTFSVLFAFYPPIFTYDEPLQYALVFAAMLCFLKRKRILFVLLITLALIAKESTLFLLPGFLYLYSTKSKKFIPKITFGRFLVLGLPLVFYMGFLWFYLGKMDFFHAFESELPQRFSCWYQNFGSHKNSIETIISFCLVIGPFLYLLALNWKNNLKNQWVKAFLVTLAINTPIVLLATLARESRLFALPLLFLWPVFFPLFGQQIALLFNKSSYADYFAMYGHRLILSAAVLLALLIAIGHYRLGLGHNNLFSPYLFITLLLIATHFLLWRDQKRKQSRIE